MKYKLQGHQEIKFPQLMGFYSGRFSGFTVRPPKTLRNYLFLNPVLRPALNVINRFGTYRISSKNRNETKIKEKFRKNLIKPCKSLKKVISYCLDFAKRSTSSRSTSKSSTRQYQGFRYSVSPEMEFASNELILGRLDVKQFASKQARYDG